MRDQTDRSVESLLRKLEGFEEHLLDLKKRLSTEHEVSRTEIERKIEATERAVKRIKDDSLAARARMQVQEEEKALAANGQVEAWKRDRDRVKLRSRAEEAEAYAAWSLIVATRTIDEAGLATLKAIAARMDFENGSNE
jgi:hypothetical protein